MITVVGGSGFVGSYLIQKIQKSKKVVNLDKNKSPFFQEITTIGNILNREEIIFNPETKHVVLLAAEHRDDVSPTSLYFDVNVKGTKNVLDAMDNANIKNIIFTSTVAIYGLNKSNPNENHPQDPFNYYGKSKWEAEIAIKEWYENDPKEKSVTIIRPTVIFGERNRGNVYNLFKEIVSGRFLMIGKGNNKKSMSYVGNITAFIENRLEFSEKDYQVFNYSDKPDFTMLELISVIENKLKITIPKLKIPFWIGMSVGYFFDFLILILRKKLSLSSVRVKKFCATTQFDSNKAHSIFKAPFTLEEGLKKTLDHEFVNAKQNDTLFYTE
jgi:nucleoside-diphosphate-sugar epimerase